jgi:hypothetical protein
MHVLNMQLIVLLPVILLSIANIFTSSFPWFRLQIWKSDAGRHLLSHLWEINMDMKSKFNNMTH